MRLTRRLLSICAGGLGACALAAAAYAGGGGPWSDDWDSYATGQDMHGVGGWLGWDNNTGATAFTTDDQFSSSPNSIEIVGPSDLVQTFDSVTSGQWTLRTMVYVPGTMEEVSYFIVLNLFTHGDVFNRNWSSQVLFDGAANIVMDDDAEVTSTPVPLITDQWVELRYEIDLDNDSFEVFYNGQSFVTGPWAQGGELSIDAIDLWGNLTTSPVYYDDLSLVPAAQVATLTDWAMGIRGTHLSGGLPELSASDNTFHVTRSQFGFLATEPNVIYLILGFDSPNLTPAALELTEEHRLNQTGGTVRWFLKNWNTNGFELVHTYPIGATEITTTLGGISATNRVRASDGRIEWQTRAHTVSTFSILGFDQFNDFVGINVQ